VHGKEVKVSSISSVISFIINSYSNFRGKPPLKLKPNLFVGKIWGKARDGNYKKKRNG